MSPPVQDLIRNLENRDIRLEVVDDRLVVDAPKGALTPELRQQLMDHKDILVSVLKPNWATDARKLIDTLPDHAVVPVLRNYYADTVASQIRQGLGAEEAEKQAFGLLLFQILRCGIDASVTPGITEPGQ